MPRKTVQSEQIKSILEKPRNILRNEIADRIAIGEDLLQKQLLNTDDLRSVGDEYRDWDDYNEELLKQAFNRQDNEYWYEYSRANYGLGFTDALDRRIDTDSFPYKVEQLKIQIQNCVTNLRRLSNKLPLIEESKNINQVKAQVSTIIVPQKMFYNKCFIVHGHNQERKLEVARFIDKDLEKETIILHEQPNKGRTIIEKFEAYTEVDFAVVLWTADDSGKANIDSTYASRARQNVVFETGFFIGKSGRKRVIVLREIGVELPTDYSGVIFITLSDNWKDELRKEINEIYAME